MNIYLNNIKNIIEKSNKFKIIIKKNKTDFNLNGSKIFKGFYNYMKKEIEKIEEKSEFRVWESKKNRKRWF